MAQIGKILLKIFKWICYLSLAVMIAGFFSLVGVFIFDFCQDVGGAQIKCIAPFYRSMFEFGFMVTMMGVFTGLPILLALGGVVFLVRDIWFRSRDEKHATP